MSGIQQRRDSTSHTGLRSPTSGPRAGTERGLAHYLLVSYLLVVGNAALDFHPNVAEHLGVAAYSALLCLTYGFIYLLPSVLLTLLVRFVLFRRRGTAAAEPGAWRRRSLIAVAVGTVGLTQIVIFADRGIYEVFGFHINGFVWNLVVTPGGLESMGTSRGAMITYTAICLGFLVVQVLVALVLFRTRQVRRWSGMLTRQRYVMLLIAFLIATGVERLAYGISDVYSFARLLVATDSLPLYMRLSLRSVAHQLGIEAPPSDDSSIGLDWSRLTYPLEPLELDPPTKLPNIVWLTAESLRADVLDPEIMPATWRFGERAHRFTQHYSGGRGTRMGMFSMFYGLYGSYWWPFLTERRGPILIDTLLQLGYDFDLRTSARFSYPEFDKTIFSAIPAAQLHEIRDGEGWERDRRNVDELLDFLDQRDASRPFMSFIFFESAHSKYYFPAESVIRKDFLPDLNYATMNLEQDIARIKNRYINAVHHLDSQLERVLAALEERQLLDQTIVIITGDHGEEFMEKGRWGHNSTFSEEQTLVPLVLWVPDSGASVVDRMTSHLDLAPTVLPLLGVKNPPQDYSLGNSLLGPQVREFTIVAAWGSVCRIDSRYKEEFAFRARSFLGRPEPVRLKHDEVLVDAAEFAVGRGERLMAMMVEMGRFVGGR